MAAAAQVAQGHPASRRRTRTLICPSCREPRDVTYETWNRIRRGQLSGVCRDCPGPPPEILVTDEHRRFWLEAYGVHVADGVTAVAYVKAHGLPPGLLSLAASIASIP